MKRYAILIASAAVIGAFVIVLGPEVEKERSVAEIVALDLSAIKVTIPTLDAEVTPLYAEAEIVTSSRIDLAVILSEGEPVSSPKQARAPPRARAGLS